MVALVGDSTVNDEGGWGPGLRASFDTRVYAATSRGEYKDSFERGLGYLLAWAAILSGAQRGRRKSKHWAANELK